MIAAISIAPYLTDKGEHRNIQCLKKRQKDLNNPATLAVTFALAKDN